MKQLGKVKKGLISIVMSAAISMAPVINNPALKGEVCCAQKAKLFGTQKQSFCWYKKAYSPNLAELLVQKRRPILAVNNEVCFFVINKLHGNSYQDRYFSAGNQTEAIQTSDDGQQNSQDPKATFFLLYHKPGNLGYKEESYLIPLDKVYSRVVKKNDTIEKWWIMEGGSYDTIKLAKLIFLTINKPEYYPKKFPEEFDLETENIVLIAGKPANFVDINGDKIVLEEQGQLAPLEDVLKITSLKNNQGGLYDKRRNPR
jgi:hypothetical protein